VNRILRNSLGLGVALVLLVAAPTFAQRRGGRVYGGRSYVFVGGYFYNPFFGPYPWWAPGAYPYPYYPIYDDSADLRVQVSPKNAAVYVDGYYAGIVDDFDGFFQRLNVPPGAHELTLFLDGYRTVHQQLYLAPRSTFRVRYTMEHLAAGETSEKPVLAPPVPEPPAGSYVPPRTPPRGPFAPPPPGPPVGIAPPPGVPGASTNVGTIVLRVQPGGAEVLIDGERWTSSDDARLVVQVSEGRHHVEVHKDGYRPLSTDVDVRGGATTPLNVSLSPQ
jgi:PEGA domain-containing protein